MSIEILLLLVSLAAGWSLVAYYLPSPFPPSLYERVIPYLPAADRVELAQLSGRSTTRQPAGSFLPAITRRLDWLSSGDVSVTRRLDQLGGERSVDQFRLEQCIWALVGGGIAALLLVVRGVTMNQLMPSLFLVALGGIGGALARDKYLTAMVQRRIDRMQSELPTIVELLALTVSAGSGLTAALERASRVGSGALASELQRTLDDVRLGVPLVDALQRLADRSGLKEMERFVNALVVAVDRGTPLTDVLIAQAGDAREARRRALIESGGRKEIAMMFPVVFLVLPISVLFVLFPGFYGLQIGS